MSSSRGTLPACSASETDAPSTTSGHDLSVEVDRRMLSCPATCSGVRHSRSFSDDDEASQSSRTSQSLARLRVRSVRHLSPRRFATRCTIVKTVKRPHTRAATPASAHLPSIRPTKMPIICTTVCCAPFFAPTSATLPVIARCCVIAALQAPADTPHIALKTELTHIMMRKYFGKAGASMSIVIATSLMASANIRHFLMLPSNLPEANAVNRRPPSIEHPSRRYICIVAARAVVSALPTPMP
mmetsp:Transcript_7437/g.14464  ORF Transcript_7437/g.14464 Transcript_7437/m.14464 type:complete len:242 (-) Transcript_7437:563-1288(-)